MEFPGLTELLWKFEQLCDRVRKLEIGLDRTEGGFNSLQDTMDAVQLEVGETKAVVDGIECLVEQLIEDPDSRSGPEG